MRSATAFLAIVGGASVASSQACGLHNAVKASGRYFGTAVDAPGLASSQYMKILNNTADWGQITPGNAQKWDSTERERGKFSYDAAERIVSIAARNGQKLRCHTLVWHQQVPRWLTNGKFDNATLISILENHIKNVAGHFKGKCMHWDVVNEALDVSSGGWRPDSIWQKTIGQAYIPIAFKAAAKADPSAKLYYNDFNTDWPSSSKIEGVKKIVKLIKDSGAKIDGVGFQAHLQVGKSPSKEKYKEALQSIVALGVEVAITELDVRAKVPISSADAQQQVKDYANVVAACKEVEKCVGVTIWDFVDKFSWVPETFKGEGSALLWDDQFQRKDVLYRAVEAAAGAPKSCT